MFSREEKGKTGKRRIDRAEDAGFEQLQLSSRSVGLGK